MKISTQVLFKKCTRDSGEKNLTMTQTQVILNYPITQLFIIRLSNYSILLFNYPIILLSNYSSIQYFILQL